MWEPFGTSSFNATASWKSGCKERGTLSILTTCLITLILCVYTTLHLNIPEHGKSSWIQRLKRKALWLLIGLFAPEFVSVQRLSLPRSCFLQRQDGRDY
jgi:hypothetical protein